jgi:polyisoprenoid-binding protein YceI
VLLLGRKLFLVILVATLVTQIIVQAQHSSSAQGAATPHSTSTITIHVQKSGFFAAFAHNHVITAPVAHGTVDRQRMSAEIVVATKDMKVVDPEVSEKDRAEIQQTMLGPKVLDAEKFREIRFQTSHVQEIGPQRYRVSGTLELHGTSKELGFDATGSPDHYQGKTRLKQTNFGIQPVSIAGGTVKVKDEIELEFDIYPAQLARPE